MKHVGIKLAKNSKQEKNVVKRRKVVTCIIVTWVMMKHINLVILSECQMAYVRKYEWNCWAHWSDIYNINERVQLRL